MVVVEQAIGNNKKNETITLPQHPITHSVHNTPPHSTPPHYSLRPLLVGKVDAVGGLDTLVLEYAHVDLQGEQGEHHQAEDR